MDSERFADRDAYFVEQGRTVSRREAREVMSRAVVPRKG
jgi:hypothetical protein